MSRERKAKVIYLIPLPPNRLDKRERAIGWRHMPLEREGRKALADLVKQLDGKGISEVWSSDLDEDAARFVAEQLKVPFRQDFQLRRFNFGRHHATPLSKAETILSELIAK